MLHCAYTVPSCIIATKITSITQLIINYALFMLVCHSIMIKTLLFLCRTKLNNKGIQLILHKWGSFTLQRSAILSQENPIFVIKTSFT
jgi:hypothetical protein